MERLLCLICQLPHRSPKMCPHCSEVYCASCIAEYLRNYHFCPKCDNYIFEMHDCKRLFDEIKEHLHPAQQTSGYPPCPQHSLPLRYFCQECQEVICSDCGVIEQKHKQHKITAQSAQLNRLSLERLKEYQSQTQGRVQFEKEHRNQCLIEKEVIRSELKYTKSKLLDYYEHMLVKTEQQADKILCEIDAEIAQHDEQARKCAKILEDLQEAISCWSHQENLMLAQLRNDNVILKVLSAHRTDYDCLEQQINSSHYPPQLQSQVQSSRKTLSTLQEIQPEYVNHTFELDYEGSREQEKVYSPHYFINGYIFRLKIYPSGNNHSKDTYLSIFLELCGSEDYSHEVEEINLYYRLELISLNAAGKSVSKEFNSLFVNGSCWGYNDFVPLDSLHDYLTNSRLIFVMGVRNVSYYEKCKLMQASIDRLEHQNKELEILAELHGIERRLGMPSLANNDDDTSSCSDIVDSD